MSDIGKTVSLTGWVNKNRDQGGMIFIDLRDRYGITQLVFNMDTNAPLCEEARKLGREYVILATGTVAERSNKNQNIPTGEIEIIVTNLSVLNAAELPPFTMDDETDGGEELRMKSFKTASQPQKRRKYPPRLGEFGIGHKRSDFQG